MGLSFLERGAVSEDIVNLNGVGTLNGDIVATIPNKGIVNITADTSSNGNFGIGGALSAVNITGGTFTLNNNIEATTTTINSGTTLTPGTSASTITGALVNSGTLNIGSKHLAIAGNITGTGALAVTLSSTASGYIDNTTNTAGYTPGGAATITPTLTTSISSGTKYALIWGNTGNSPTLGSTSAASQGLISWAISDGRSYVGDTDINGHTIIAEDVIMIPTVRSVSSVSGVSSEAAAALDTVIAAARTSSQLESIAISLQNLSTASEFVSAANQLRPEVNRSSIEGSTNAVAEALNAVSSRNDAIRRQSSRNSVIRGLRLWGQIFGHHGTQNQRQGVSGYAAKTLGVALGADTRIAQQIQGGVALSYASSVINAKGSNSGDNSGIDSYQTTLYGTYIGEPYYIDTSLSVAMHQYSTERQISFTGFSDIADSRYKGYQYTAKIDGGHPINTGLIIVTPTLGASYSFLKQNSYTESSTNGSALHLNQQTISSVKSSVGTKFTKTVETESFTYTPELDIAWTHEFKSDPLRTTASYVAGGSSFTSTSVKPAKDALIVGAGLTVIGADNLTIRGKYHAEFRESYLGHNGMIEARLNF